MSTVVNKSKEQRAAEAEVDSFRKELGPFVTATESTRMAMAFTAAIGGNSPIIFANDSFLALTGYIREEVIGQNFISLVSRGAEPASLKAMEAALDGERQIESDVCFRRKDGSLFWAQVFVSPVRDEHGNVAQHFLSLIDFTKHKEEQSQAMMLIDELNHRVKNTLATVQSIVAQTLRKTSDPQVIGASIQSRIFALSRSHDLLTREHWTEAGLLDLVDAALQPFMTVSGRAERLVVKGPRVRIPPKATLALGIAFNELATNAVKYGAFSNDSGSVWISWTIERGQGGDRLMLIWRESGGPPVVPPAHKGFGSQVVERGLAHELGGTVHLDFPPGGVVCTIDIPMAGPRL